MTFPALVNKITANAVIKTLIAFANVKNIMLVAVQLLKVYSFF